LGKIPSSSPSSGKESPWREEELPLETLKQIETLLQRIERGETRDTFRDVLVQGAKLEQHRKRSK
jgi:hypothetical protein